MAKNKKTKKKTKQKPVKSIEFVSELARLARLMRAAEHEIGLNPAQWEALRFLARCNKSSNSPIALTRYLGATKGTISQTVIALVKKGLVEKTNRKGERRSVALTVTGEGYELLQEDPWKRVEHAFETLGPKKRATAASVLAVLMEDELDYRRDNDLSAWPSKMFFKKKKKAKKKSKGKPAKK